MYSRNEKLRAYAEKVHSGRKTFWATTSERRRQPTKVLNINRVMHSGDADSQVNPPRSSLFPHLRTGRVLTARHDAARRGTAVLKGWLAAERRTPPEDLRRLNKVTVKFSSGDFGPIYMLIAADLATDTCFQGSGILSWCLFPAYKLLTRHVASFGRTGKEREHSHALEIKLIIFAYCA